MGYPDQLVGFRGGAGHQHPIDRLVERGARCGEPEGTGPQSFGRELGHPPDVIGGRGLIVGTAITHDVRPQCAMGKLRAHVHHPLVSLQHIEVLGE